jgi:starch synthase (maltosyl-transferring)
MSPTDPTGPRFRIEDIYPCVDGGRYPVKRVAGESVEVWADIFRDGHDVIAAALLWRSEAADEWQRAPMQLDNNDRWHGSFTPPEPGWYLFAIEAWTDHYATWRKEFRLKQEAGQDVTLAAREGHQLLAEFMPREAAARRAVESAAKTFTKTNDPAVLLDDVLAAAMEKTENRPDLSRSHVVPLVADR